MVIFLSRYFEIIIFCFVVAICDLVHAVKAMYDLPFLKSVYNKFAVSRASLLHQKIFQYAVTTSER